MNNTFQNRTVGDLVTERPGRAEVMEKYGIDYCCGGGRPLAEACASVEVDPVRVAAELSAADAANPREATPGWETMSLAALTDHVVDTHHAYLGTALPRITALVEKVVKAHGQNHPELAELQGLFAGFAEELRQHMAKEEVVLFPMIRQLEATGEVSGHCGGVQNPIGVMRLEHDAAGDALARMRQLTGGYTPPEDACNTYRVMLHSLYELERDMHRHVHLENNVLFPRAIETQARNGIGA